MKSAGSLSGFSGYWRQPPDTDTVLLLGDAQRGTEQTSGAATGLETERRLSASPQPGTAEQESQQMWQVTQKRADMITTSLRGAGIFIDHMA